MNLFENLSAAEKELLLKFPVYISLLAANADGKMDEEEKKVAIKLTHIKTYSCAPELSEFYKEVDKSFEKQLEQIDLQLPKDKNVREEAINSELLKFLPILLKLGAKNLGLIKKSMKSYIEHVSKAHSSVVESFLLPIHIEGLTD